MIYNNEGKGIRIRDLGKVVERNDSPTIERKDRERVITVSAVAGKGSGIERLGCRRPERVETNGYPIRRKLAVRLEHSKISRIHLPIWVS